MMGNLSAAAAARARRSAPKGRWVPLPAVLLLVLLLPFRPLAAQQAAPPAPQAPQAGPALAPAPAGAPVVLGRDTLFFVQGRLGPFSEAERAAAIRSRLERLAEDPYTRLDSVLVVPGEQHTDVMVGDIVVTTVTEADAALAGVPHEVLARRHAALIAMALQDQGLAARLRIILLGVLFALLATIATVLIVRLVNGVFPRVFAALEEGRNTWMPGLRIQKLELISSSHLTDALLAVARAVRVVTLALLLYISLPTILSFFPWTRRYADQLFGYILTPFATVWAGFLSYLPNFFAIGAIVIVTWYLLKLIRPVFLGIARGTITFSGFYPDWAMPTYQIVRTLITIFAFIAIWPYLPGSGSAAFQGVGVFLGLLISLGSAAAIGNMVGGVVLTYMRPFRVGDRVKIADTMGDVVEKTLLVTRVRTPKNVDVTIPNSMVLSSHIINYSSSAKAAGLILHTTVTIGYDVPWRQVHALLIAAANDVPGVVADPPPFVLQTSLDDFFVSYELNAYTDRPNRMAASYSALHANIQDRFNEAGVEILSPHYRAERDGSPTTIPGEFRAPAGREEF
jgi:small-conductance mechanosensitive channel